jgi:hypothetical protein
MAASAFPLISECRTAHRTEDHAAVIDSPVSIGPMIRRATFPSPSCPATHFGQLRRRCCQIPLRRVLHAEVVFVSSLIMKRSGSTRARAAELMITSADVWPLLHAVEKHRPGRVIKLLRLRGNSGGGSNESPFDPLPSSASAVVI